MATFSIITMAEAKRIVLEEIVQEMDPEERALSGLLKERIETARNVAKARTVFTLDAFKGESAR